MKSKYKYKNRDGITGVTMGFSFLPQLAFSGKIYFSSKCDYMFYKSYFPNGPYTWPVDPYTGGKLPIEEKRR